MISKDIHGNEYEITAADLSWRPAAYGIVLHDNRILLVKQDGKYHLPGGGIELGEDPRSAAVREVREESGIVVTNPQLIDVNSSFFTWQKLEPPQAFVHVHALLLYYACTFAGGRLGDTKLDEYEQLDQLSAEWVPAGELDRITVGTTVDWRPIVQRVL